MQGYTRCACACGVCSLRVTKIMSWHSRRTTNAWTQFHLPAGNPAAQPLDGVVTLAYESLAPIRSRLEKPPAVLATTQFEATISQSHIALTDPWGTRFTLIEREDAADPRGAQPGADQSAARALVDLTLHVKRGASLAGIGRFYERILGMPVLSCDETRLVLGTGGERADGAPRQTLTFVDAGREDVAHEDIGESDEGQPVNNGAHVSLYLEDVRDAYCKAEALGLCFVNHRFKRRAHTLDEAIEQCMFRILDVVDPDNVEAGPILRLEHEVRSATKRDGSRYKSCPLEIVVGQSAD